MSYQDATEEYLTNAQRQIKLNMNEENANATGRTSNSVKVLAKAYSGELSALDSIISAQDGTPPKSKGGGITISAAQTWIGAKGLDMNAERLAIRINEEGSYIYRNSNKERDIYTSVLDDKQADEEYFNSLLDETLDEFLNALEL